jgi:hypothetical protein
MEPPKRLKRECAELGSWMAVYWIIQKTLFTTTAGYDMKTSVHSYDNSPAFK